MLTLIKALATAQGLDTNVWIIGVEELINRIELLINELIKQLGASEGTVFDAIGLSISGGSQKKMADRIKSALKVVYYTLYTVKHTFSTFVYSRSLTMRASIAYNKLVKVDQVCYRLYFRSVVGISTIPARFTQTLLVPFSRVSTKVLFLSPELVRTANWFDQTVQAQDVADGATSSGTKALAVGLFKRFFIDISFQQHQFFV